MTTPMTIQEAAHLILRELKRPTISKELAQIALKRGLAGSNAQNRVESLAQTLEKNIRDRVYNKPELKFVYSPQGARLLALSEWEDKREVAQTFAEPASTAELKARIRSDLLEQIQLAVQSRIANTFDETVALLLRQGLTAKANDIRNGLMRQLNELSKGQISQDAQPHDQEKVPVLPNNVEKQDTPQNSPKNQNAPGTIGQDEMYYEVHRVLQSLGKPVSKRRVEEIILEKYRSEFTKEWYQEAVSHGIPRWKHNIAWAKERLKHEGLIKWPSEAGHGIWELTESGKKKEIQ